MGIAMNSFRLFGLKRKSGVFCPIEGPPEWNGQAFLSCTRLPSGQVAGLRKEKKTVPKEKANYLAFG